MVNRMEFVPNPANYEMKRGPGVAVLPQANPGGISEAELASLDAMTKDELITLIKRVSGAMWGIGLKTPQEIAEAFKLKLAISGLTERDISKALPAMREWFDREMGKPLQQTQSSVTIGYEPLVIRTIEHGPLLPK